MGGFASKESGVLKLVYPGGIAEIHKEPITAAEVMKRNPRHCVTRPDIFRFPWIVVRPESVLKPGRVFFIVPYHTIYGLLQSKEFENQQDYLCPRQKGGTSLTSNRTKKLGPGDFSTEMVPFHGLFQKMTSGESTASSKEAKRKFEDRPTGCFPSKFRERRPLMHSIERIRNDEQVRGSLNSSEQISELRSCLKKETTSIAKSRGLKVRFALDHEDDKKRFCSDSLEFQQSDF